MSVDPLMMENGETYGYAAENPLNRADPSGKSWWWPPDWFSKTKWERIGMTVEAVGGGIMLIPVPGAQVVGLAFVVAGGVVNFTLGINDFIQGDTEGGLVKIGYTFLGVGGGGLALKLFTVARWFRRVGIPFAAMRDAYWFLRVNAAMSAGAGAALMVGGQFAPNGPPPCKTGP